MHILKVTKEDELGLQRKLYSIFSFVLLACTFQYRNEIAIPLFWQYINIYTYISNRFNIISTLHYAFDTKCHVYITGSHTKFLFFGIQ